MKRVGILLTLVVTLLGFGFSQTQIAPVEAQAEMIRNGNFSSGMQYWGTWDAIVYRVQNGVLEFYRTSAGASAAVLQGTGVNVAAGSKLRATFQFANPNMNISNGQKRVTVILHAGDWSDLQACTFMLAEGTPISTYEMEAFVPTAWNNVTISFYHAMGDGSTYLQVDNVSLKQEASLPTNRVRCIDPYKAASGFDPDSSNFAANGDFATGTTQYWGLSGEIVSRVQNGVFEYYSVTGGPAAVILQNMSSTNSMYISNGQIGEARFQLGNSSNVRKRVSVLLHSSGFDNIQFCTFWLPANTPTLQTYIMRFFNSQYWQDYITTASFYVTPFDNAGWARIDNVNVRRRPGLSIVGTECHYPGSLGADDGGAFGTDGFTMPTLLPTATGMPSFGLPFESPVQPFIPAPDFNGDSSSEGSIGE